MFDLYDYLVSEEHRKDLLREAASFRRTHTREMPRRKSGRNRLALGGRFLALIARVRSVRVAITSPVAPDHQGLSSGSGTR